MQHTIAPHDHRAVLAGLWRGLAAVPGRHRATGTSLRRILGIAVVLAAGLAVVAHVSWLAFLHATIASRSSVSSATASRGSAVAADWIRANLPPGIHVLADGFDPPAGYQPVPLATAGDNWTNYSYLLTATTTTPPSDSDLAPVWRSSVPVAVFADVEVRFVLPLTSADQIRRDLDKDTAERTQAGQALLRNAQLASTPAARAVLDHGGLDLRAAAALSAVVAQVPVTLTNVVVVPAEAAAAMPARALTLYSSEPATVTQALSGLSTAFAPDQVSVGENGAIDLHWPLSVTPMPSVN